MKRLMTILAALLMAVLLVVPVSASVVDEHVYSRVIDEADLLTAQEEADLEEVLAEYSELYAFDMVVLTADDMGGQDIISYADDYYDYNGYGYGSDYDGCILILNMTTREWYISTCGYGIVALNDMVIDQMAEVFVPLLSSGDYYKGFVTFTEQCAYYVDLSLNGGGDMDTMTGIYPDDFYDGVYEDEYYEDHYYDDGYTTGSSTVSLLPALLGMGVLALVVGFFIAFVPMFRLKKQLKSVAKKAAAADYVKPGSKRITKSRDAFLYSNVTRMPKPKENKSGSRGGMSFGGGVHIGSSGRSHGGGGGRF